MRWITGMWAEMVKSHQHNFHSKMIYFSLLIWPVLLFLTSYYSLKPFNLEATSPIAEFVDPDSIMLFLLTGFLGYIFFWSLVQSAWQTSYERQTGTLELIFLTPVSRLAFVYGRSAGNLFEAAWLFTVFSVLLLVALGGPQSIIWSALPIAFLILIISAVVWGGFLNVVFLFSRDASILFTILEEPMQFFAGVRLPVAAFPIWGKVIAVVFPLTFVLDIFRGLVIKGQHLSQLSTSLFILAGILIGLIFLTTLLMKLAEKHAKQSGNMVLF
ncbi:ABC transporter permease [Alkalihalobacillus sp. AL-G]|uniref:ABC transporter permease n=1 Tax=Alkalihalobacillus sp. AL-G TaxID=2926399 RepID=UPI00272CF2B0|nr:ABC transporter permease [Alkalihalobacillus sp. AL-G]WLD94659.1 ABC transporter permease [Alkalihalobacillus sp. AL-G]